MKSVKLVATVTKERAKAILAPYLEPLAESIERAWERWLALPAKDRKAAGPRTRANFVYDFICEEIRMRFENMPGVSVETTPHSMLWLNIQGVLVLRFKKLDNLKLGSNISTGFQTQFTAQLQLPGLPDEAARLVVGYQLDRVQSKITSILVTYRIENRVEWFFAARDSGVASGAVPAPLPFPTAPVKKPRVTSKKPDSAAQRRRKGAAQGDDAGTDNQRKTSDQ